MRVLTAILLLIALATGSCRTADGQDLLDNKVVPLVDHHQHLLSPAGAALQNADSLRERLPYDVEQPVVGEHLVAMLDRAGIKRAVVLSDAYWFDSPPHLRPTNGRADDQERRNHAVQYISHPDWPWFRLRKESPEKYESYVDLLPGVWTKVKIDVRGERARLYVHGHEQPTLIVNDLKTGAQGRGGVALWIDRGTVAHFRNLSVETSAKDGSK